MKWILTVGPLHLGFCKETFGRGAVIEFDDVNRRLVVDGRKFEDIRDLDVLLRQAKKNPDKPWIVPFSQDTLDAIVSSDPKKQEDVFLSKSVEGMKIIESDEDLRGEIDIRSTKISNVNAAKKASEQNKKKTGTLEVIRGDESIEERLSLLKGKNDPASIAARAALKSTGAVKMSVVKDDTLGDAGGKHTIARNAGQVYLSREEIEKRGETARLEAESRKRESDSKRVRDNAVGIEINEEVKSITDAPSDVILVSTDSTVVEQKPDKPRRGRPLGSKNKVKVQK